MTFGEFISEKRIKKQLSLREMAKIVGISHVYLCHLESNVKTNPDIKILREIIKVLGLNEEEAVFLYDLQAEANGNASTY